MNEPTTVAFVSLGCAKNLVDSEKMLGLLAQSGCVLTNDETDADVIVINTCGFLEASRTEAVEEIQQAVANKNKGAVKRVVVAGCLVQRDGTSLLQHVQGIDALVGVNNRDDIVRAVIGDHNSASSQVPLSNKNQKRDTSLNVIASAVSATNPSTAQKNGDHKNAAPDLYLSDYHPFTQLATARLRLTPRHYAYLRISEGCDQKCTFCTIPSIRGPMHSKPPALILREAHELISDGTVEISLIGQDTTSYGYDLNASSGLADLLRSLNAVDGVGWIRLMYVYPSVLTDEMLDAMASSEKICNYIDIPLQHISDRVLKSMHRRINRADTESLMQRIRDRIPGVAIRTTLIAGFPGETDAEFEELLTFVQEFGFDALGVFPYSLEPDTPSGRMKNQISDRVKEERVGALMTAQQDVAFAQADRRIGQRFRVLIDNVGSNGIAEARHEGQAPSVDSLTFVRHGDVRPGQFMDVRCVARQDYDLIAEPVNVTLPVV